MAKHRAAKAKKLTWDLSQLYVSLKDPKIEKDTKAIERSCSSFATKYGAARFTASPETLLRALRDYEVLQKKVGGAKPLVYAWYIKEIDSTNADADALANRLSQRLTHAENETIFFELCIGAMPKQQQQNMLKNKQLAPYHYFLSRIFLNAEHQLGKKEEQILSLLSLPSNSLWVNGYEKTLNKLSVSFQGRHVPFAQAIGTIPQLKTRERRLLHRAVHEQLKTTADFAEAEINAIVTDKKIRDELRSFKKPYSATVLGYENSEKSIETLQKVVSDRFTLGHRFYQAKRKLLGMKTLQAADRNASVGAVTKQYTFDEAYELVHRSFSRADPEFARVLAMLVDNKRVDVYPSTGKTSGAFCSSTSGTPTFVLMNFTGDMRSVSTLAHEMGHAVHTELSRSQPILYQDYSTSTAETASTFFEGLVFNDVFATLSDKEQRIALHDKLQDKVNTVFRQIAFFNFELELHQRIRREGALPAAEIARLYNKHIASYVGNAVTLSELDGYSFAYVSHFRRYFYVYSYAYGELVSCALYNKYKNDEAFIEKIKFFLSRGGSATPDTIFADIGVRADSRRFFEQGLDEIEADVAKLETLTKK